MIPYLHIGPFLLPTFGLMVATGLFCASYMLQADFRRRGIHSDAFLIIGIAGLAGIVGARLYHVLETPSEFLAHPWPFLYTRFGFAWFGGFLGGFAALLTLSRREKIPALTFLDACSPAAAAGYAIGRIGCLLSGDGDYGIPTKLPWGMSFPDGVVPTTETCVQQGCTTGETTVGSPVTVTNGVVPNSADAAFNSAGTFYWKAFYSGDANNNSSESACNVEILTVNARTTSITTALQKGAGTPSLTLTVIVGDSVHDTSSLSGQTSNAGGTVTYKFYTNVTCTTGETTVGSPVTVTNGVVPNSADAAFNSAGTFFWKAFYSGDSNNNSSESLCNEVLTVGARTTSITTALQKGAGTPSLTLTVNAGDNVHDTATLSGQTSNAGGTVTYKFYTNTTCTTGETTVGSRSEERRVGKEC